MATSPKKFRFLIRTAQPDDLGACLALSHAQEIPSVWQVQTRETDAGLSLSFQALTLPRPIRLDYPRNSAALQHDLQTAEGWLVAEQAAQILGYVQMNLLEADRRVWVRNLVVDEAWRRRRIGKALLEQARLWAQGRRCQQLTLETTPRNVPAIRFMQGQGLRFCGYHEHYYANQDLALFFGQSL